MNLAQEAYKQDLQCLENFDKADLSDSRENIGDIEYPKVPNHDDIRVQTIRYRTGCVVWLVSQVLSKNG